MFFLTVYFVWTAPPHPHPRGSSAVCVCWDQTDVNKLCEQEKKILRWVVVVQIFKYKNIFLELYHDNFPPKLLLNTFILS